MLITIIVQGCLYGIAVLGVVLTIRFMNFPDLTADGSFTLGAAVSSTMLVNGHSILASVSCAVIAGLLAGFFTAFLNRKLGISKILSGILTMLMLYSVNLRIMGKANISLLRTPTAFQTARDGYLIVGVLFLSVIVLLIYLATTRIGLLARASGDNETMVNSIGINPNYFVYGMVGFGNALIAFSGSLVSQFQGFADVNMGTGLIIVLLAALIIGESVLDAILFGMKKLTHIFQIQKKLANASILPWSAYMELVAASAGTILYFGILTVCLGLGLAPTDLKLATGVLVIIGVSLRFKSTMTESYMREKL